MIGQLIRHLAPLHVVVGRSYSSLCVFFLMICGFSVCSGYKFSVGCVRCESFLPVCDLTFVSFDEQRFLNLMKPQFASVFL